MHLNKLLKSLLTSLGLLSLLLFPTATQAFGVSPSTVQLGKLLPEQVYEHRFYLSDSNTSVVRNFELRALEDPYNILSFASETLVLGLEETEGIGRIYIDTRGLNPGAYNFSVEIKENIEGLEGVNRIVPGITFSGHIEVTDEVFSDLNVNNLRLIKDEEEESLSFALNFLNDGNVSETPDLIELIIEDQKGETMHTEAWISHEEILPFQGEELLFEVNLPKMKAGNHVLHVSVLEKGEWIYESKALPYQVIAKARPDWLVTVLLVSLLTVSLYLYFSSRPSK